MAGVAWPVIAAHRERLLRIARRRCATPEDAEDVVSEAMLRAAAFDGLDEDRLEQFLTSVTVRLCVDLHRRSDRGARAVVRLLPDLDETAPSPEDEVCQAVEAEVLNDLLESLPVRQRAVLADRASGLSLTQIARRHALTYKATESALSRARGTMRAALAAALSGVLGGLAALRPRRAAVVSALPVVTLVLVGTVVRLPAPDREETAAPPPAGGTVESVYDAEPRPGAGRPRAVARAERPARLVRAEPRVVLPPARLPDDDTINAGAPNLGVGVEPPDDTYVAQLRRCVEEGTATIVISIEPSNEPLSTERRCAPPPEHD